MEPGYQTYQIPKVKTETQQILEKLDYGHQKVWGFKVYRLTYEDDAKWKISMEKLDKDVRDNLSDHPPEGITLIERLDRAVEHDREKHFKQLADIEIPKFTSVPRYTDAPMKDWPFVKALDGDFSEEKVRLEWLEAEQDWDDYLRNCQEDGEEIREDQCAYGNDEPMKVGFLKVPVPSLIPDLYTRLDNGFAEAYHLGPTPPKLWL